MESFVDFASSKKGRSLRIVAGSALIVYSAAATSGSLAKVLIIIGGLLIISGLLGFCLLNKVVGRSISACPKES